MPKQSANKPAAPEVLLVGASGTLGRAVHAELALRHQVLAASRNGQLKVDITDSTSIRQMFKKTGKVDAIVCTAGKVHFGALAEMTEELYAIGLRDKLMGQVNLSLIGRDYLNDGGSITLITGILAEQPIRLGSSASMVNGAIEAFVRAAAVELPRPAFERDVGPSVGHMRRRSYFVTAGNSACAVGLS